MVVRVINVEVLTRGASVTNTNHTGAGSAATTDRRSAKRRHSLKHNELSANICKQCSLEWNLISGTAVGRKFALVLVCVVGGSVGCWQPLVSV